jgi:hypothetical protein
MGSIMLSSKILGSFSKAKSVFFLINSMALGGYQVVCYLILLL